MSIIQMLRDNQEDIIRQYNDGKSTCELGRQYGCNNAYIWTFLKDLGVTIHKTKVVDAELTEKVHELYKQGHSAYKITKDLNLSRSTAERILQKLGYDTSKGQRRHKDGLLKDKTEKIINMYNQHIGCTTIAREVGSFDSAVNKLLKKNGVEIRPDKDINVDETFFDEVDTIEKAYVLGFLWADGNVSQKTNYIKLSITDKDVLYEIAKIMKFDGELRESMPRPIKNGKGVVYISKKV